MFDLIVVGAGPSGCRVGELVAKKGFKVLIIEEDKRVGLPVKCAGLVSWRIKELIHDLPKNIIVNEVRKAKIFSSKKNFIELNSKKRVYVLDREKLDLFLAKKAKKAGALIKEKVRFEKFRVEKDGVEVLTSRGAFKTKLLVGADGANSRVAREGGLEQPNSLLVAMQSTVKGNFDPHSVELWFNVSPDFFGWLIPESRRKARIGIASKRRCSYHFKKFLKERIGRIVKPNVSGIIRYGLMKETVSERVMLVGDAACQVKPFSGGGIIYGLIGAGFASLTSIKALRKNDFTHEFLSENYEKLWKEKLVWPIRKGLILKKLTNSSFWFNFFISLTKKLMMESFFESWDMDLL